VEECCQFFDDLCTVTELRALEQRYDVAVLLHKGRVYTDIMQEVNASSATISRVKRMLNLGTGRLVASIEQAEKEKEETNG
ncbi:MAG: YerC/YecD family TrpR-related protein, partial [Acutalibacteraceae bacterium]